jgi:archaeosine-15-forming tRNA-guanine transglycosylase
LKTLSRQLRSDELLNDASIDAIARTQKLEERCLLLESENKELKRQIEMSDSSNKEITEEEEKKKEKDIDTFRKKTIRQYAQSGKPICNGVRTDDNWAVGTKFYINGYSRLSIYLPDGKTTRQISDPKKIEKFWKWLFDHQHRVGHIVAKDAKVDISNLIQYIDKKIVLSKEVFTIRNLKALRDGVKVIVENKNGNLMAVGNGFGGNVLDIVKCQKGFEKKAMNC